MFHAEMDQLPETLEEECNLKPLDNSELTTSFLRRSPKRFLN